MGDVTVGRACGWMNRSQPAIADGGQHHGNHGYQNHGDDVSVGNAVSQPEERHGRNGLHQDDSIKDQVAQLQDAAKLCGRRDGG